MGVVRRWGVPVMVAVTVATVLGPAAADGARRLITGAQIKNRSIGLRDLAPSARPKRGPRGPQGVPGPQGPANPAAALRIRRVQSAAVSVPTGGTATATATCPAGTVLTGGGGQADPGNNLVISRSSGNVGGLTWYVTARNDGGFPGQVIAAAYCAG